VLGSPDSHRRTPARDPAGFAARMGRLRDAILTAGPAGATRLPGSRPPAADGSLSLGDGLARELRLLAAELDVAFPGGQ
jgi:hypothetical protein